MDNAPMQSDDRFSVARGIAANVADRPDWDESEGLYANTYRGARLAAIMALNKRDQQIAALVEAFEALLAAVEFEAPPIIDGVQVASRGRILLECAGDARAALAAWEATQ